MRTPEQLEQHRIEGKAAYWRDIEKSRKRGRERARRRYAADPEAARAKNRAHYAKTPSAKIYKREWMRTNRDVYTAKATELRELSPHLYLVGKVRHRAKVAGIPCDLNTRWAKEVWTGKCAVTGAQFVTGKGQAHAYSASIDRIDPKLGYTRDNCRFVLWAVNRLKGDETDEVMREIAALILRRSDP